MPVPVVAAAIAAAAAIGTAVINNASGKAADKRQFAQQEKMQGLQVEGQKDLTKFNQEQSLEQWHNTNYGEQMKEMTSAGLSPGLMYGQGGGGGTTAQVTPGNVAQGKAERWQSNEGTGMAIDTSLQAMLMKKQTENIEANTQKTEAETAKMTGVDTEGVKQNIAESGARTGKTTQETRNAEINQQILELQKQLHENEVQVQKGTTQQRIEQAGLQNEQTKAGTAQAKQNTEKSAAETKTAQTEANNSEYRTHLANREAELRNILLLGQGQTQGAMTAETENKILKITAEIERMEAQTKQGNQGLAQDQQRIILDKVRTEFGSDAEARIRAWLNALPIKPR